MFLPIDVYLKARVYRNTIPEDWVPNSHSCEKIMFNSDMLKKFCYVLFTCVYSDPAA